MKILLVIDGSSYSDMATHMLKALRLPAETEVTILTVVPEPTFLGGITLDVIRGTSQARKKAKEEQQQKATQLLERTSQALDEGKLNVETLVRWGNPAEVILSEAEERSASLIVMGAKGLTDPLSFRLGSVALKVMKYANASVLLIRQKTATLAEEPRKKGKITTLNRVLLATDGSKCADEVIKFLLALPLPRQTEVIVITALYSHLEAWMMTPTLDFRTNQELLEKIRTAEEVEARKITGKAEKQFRDNGYKTASVVIRGGAGECIVAAAMEYNPDIVALGSKGLTGIESFLLGSVAERVARYANCSVLIGRSPR
jgi:nucleotide-binding universal stress UspA family protein